MKFTACILFAMGSLMAQVPNPTTQQGAPENTGQPMPIFKGL